MSQRITSVIRDAPIGKASDVSRIENSVVDIQAVTAKLAEDINRALDVRNEIVETISRVKNADERCLLELRYICLDSWESIARKMNFSLDHVFTLHRQALKKFAFMTNLTVNNS